MTTTTNRSDAAHFSYLRNEDGSIADCIPFRGEMPARRSLDDRDGWKVVSVPFGMEMQQAIVIAEEEKAARLAAAAATPAPTRAPRKRAEAKVAPKVDDE